jgi:tetratricopeptide (TPR) repeat protein
LTLVLLLGAVFTPGKAALAAESRETLRAAARQEALKNLEAAENALNVSATNAEVAWKLGRAFFDLAEFPKDKDEQASLAEKGISACKTAVSLSSNSVAAHYYLGLNLGQLSRTKGLGALRTIGPMQRAFEVSLALDETFDHAGPHRNLGYLFRDAPTWAGIGDRAKAKKHLERAVALDPEYMENRLALLEGRINWKQWDVAARELAAIRAAWPDAKAKVVTAAERAVWWDWEELLRRLSEKIDAKQRH